MSLIQYNGKCQIIINDAIVLMIAPITNLLVLFPVVELCEVIRLFAQKLRLDL